MRCVHYSFVFGLLLVLSSEVLVCWFLSVVFRLACRSLFVASTFACLCWRSFWYCFKWRVCAGFNFMTSWRATINFTSACFCLSSPFACVALVQAWVRPQGAGHVANVVRSTLWLHLVFVVA